MFLKKLAKKYSVIGSLPDKKNIKQAMIDSNLYAEIDEVGTVKHKHWMALIEYLQSQKMQKEADAVRKMTLQDVHNLEDEILSDRAEKSKKDWK